MAKAIARLSHMGFSLFRDLCAVFEEILQKWEIFYLEVFLVLLALWIRCFVEMLQRETKFCVFFLEPKNLALGVSKHKECNLLMH